LLASDSVEARTALQSLLNDPLSAEPDRITGLRVALIAIASLPAAPAWLIGPISSRLVPADKAINGAHHGTKVLQGSHQERDLLFDRRRSRPCPCV
jgi:hypothetical protein